MEDQPPTDRSSGKTTVGRRLHDVVAGLFPIGRSLTGPGVRETLRAIGERIPLDVHEVPSGTPVFDWTVPREWRVREAFLADEAGHRIADYAVSNLHLVGYSVPVDRVVPLEELLPHLHSLPDQPDRIPYRTSYYTETWGFCLTQRSLDALTEPRYRVRIDTELIDGSLTYGESFLPGDTPDEFLVTAHVCHPSLANDNLSSIAVSTALAERLAGRRHRLSYRFLFLPGTIGSLTWLSRNQAGLPRIHYGLTLAGLGDSGSLTYKRTVDGRSAIDRAVAIALRDSGRPHAIREFSPWGYDERQFNAPGFRLPVGLLMRTPHGEYPEYHTSGDDLGFVKPESLEASLAALEAIVDIAERDATFTNLSPFGEPQLGRRGLYSAVGGRTGVALDELAILWVLNQSDGEHSLVDIAERSGRPFSAVADAAAVLVKAGLLGPAVAR